VFQKQKHQKVLLPQRKVSIMENDERNMRE